MNHCCRAIDTPKDPFNPSVLSEAGVPFSDALWFSLLSAPQKNQALNDPRGAEILTRLRTFMADRLSPEQ